MPRLASMVGKGVAVAILVVIAGWFPVRSWAAMPAQDRASPATEPMAATRSPSTAPVISRAEMAHTPARPDRQADLTGGDLDAGGTYAQRVLALGPSAYWPLWETPGAPVAEDVTGHGFHAPYFGVALGEPGIGDGRTAARFDGAGSRVEIWSAGLSHHPNLNLMNNPGLEGFTGTADDGVSDAFACWSAGAVNDPAGNRVEATATAHGASAAVKVSRGTGTCHLSRTIPVLPGTTYDLSFWTQGNGTVAGRYAVYDVTHSTFIVPGTSTGITATSWKQVSTTFTAPAGCTQARIYAYNPSLAGFALYDDWRVTPRTGNGFNPATGTLMAWIKVSGDVWTDGQYRAVVNLASDSAFRSIIRLFKDNVPHKKMESLWYGSDVGPEYWESENVASELWQCWVMTWDQATDTFLLYRNGVKLGYRSGVGTMAAWSGALVPSMTYIGQVSAGNWPWSGRLAHVALWARVLTLAEIREVARVR